ncbi:MAG: hypothetical protein H6737_20490 [Alphaproteobacteria bacterium]|nr:hypothetical protein [Alphaproteobacteria bacterium]
MSGYDDESEGIPWTWTELGEDSFEDREARRILHDTREEQLYTQEIDARLIGLVWNCPPALADPLIVPDLTDTGWLDQIAVERGGVVPILNLDFLELGVGARDGRLVMMTDTHEEPVDLQWVWEHVFREGLERLKVALAEGRAEPPALFDDQGRFRKDDVLKELGQLGGPALIVFAGAVLGL